MLKNQISRLYFNNFPRKIKEREGEREELVKLESKKVKKRVYIET